MTARRPGDTTQGEQAGKGAPAGNPPTPVPYIQHDGRDDAQHRRPDEGGERREDAPPPDAPRPPKSPA
ncbi:MAG: hypothetical protein QM820_38835 [Minicystis sp.]